MLSDYPFTFIEPDSIQSIMRPLKSLGITGFFFIRMYPDGQFIDLTSDPDWAEFFFKKFYDLGYSAEDVNIHTYVTQGVALSELNPQNKTWLDGREHFNVGNIIILSRQYEKYYENYYFYADKNNHHINQFYLHHLDLFYKFMDYFLIQAAPLILKGEEKKFYTPEKYLMYRQNKIITNKEELAAEELRNFFKENEILAQHDYHAHGLSTKEIACLSYLIQGKSAEEISMILSRSRRTVETHIENAKRKLNCHKIAQLAYLLGKLNINLENEK